MSSRVPAVPEGLGGVWLSALLLPPAFLLLLALRRPAKSAPRRLSTGRLTAVRPTTAPGWRAEPELQVRVQLQCPERTEAQLSLAPKAPGAVLLQRAAAAFGQELTHLEPAVEPQRPLDLQGFQGGELLLAFPKTPGSPATPSRPVEAIVDFGYYEHWSKVCGSLHRFHVVVRCPKVLQEVTRDTATAQFERKQFSLLIRGAAKDYMLRRTVGARVAALPVSFPVCPDRCSLLVWPGRKVELVLRPYPPSWLQPGARVRVVRLETEDAQRLNGRQGTVQSFVEPEDKTSARYAVKMDSGTRLKLRPANLQLI